MDKINNSNEEIREIVQEVLYDVIQAFSEDSSKILETNKEEKEEKVEVKEEEVKEEEVKEDAKTEEEDEVKEILGSNMSENIISDAPITSEHNVTAVPVNTEITKDLNETVNNIPVVNTFPSTTDVTQTLGNSDVILPSTVNVPEIPVIEESQLLETPLIDTSISTDGELVPNPDTVSAVVSDMNETGSFNAFGTDISYTSNSDGTYNMTLNKNGFTRVSVVNSVDIKNIITEIEDFLVETLTTKNTDSEIVTTENLEDPTLKNVQELVNAEQEIVNTEPAESIDEDDTYNVTMSSLRKKYAHKIIEVFDLGLKAKNAILSESKDKIFAKDLKEYKTKDTIISSVLKEKKDKLKVETEKYLENRRNRDKIKKIVSIISYTVKKSQDALIAGTLSDNQSEQIISVLKNIILSMTKNYNNKNYSTILSNMLNKTEKMKVIISSTIKTQSNTLIAAKNKKIDKPIVASTKKDIKSSNIMSKKYPNKSGIINIEPETRTKNGIYSASMLRTDGVIVESNYSNINPRKTMSGNNRYDGTDEMIGEISNLVK